MYDPSVEKGSDRTISAFRKASREPSARTGGAAWGQLRRGAGTTFSAATMGAIIACLLVGCESPPDTSVFPRADAATDEDTPTVVIHDTGPVDAEVSVDTAPDLVDAEIADDVALDDATDAILEETMEDTFVSQCQAPCLNGGTCDESNGVCVCTESYYGDTCENPVVPCEAPCQNGGTCTPAGVCDCAPGWTGAACEVSACIEAPCNNGGQCIGINRCSCNVRWMGRQCQAAAPSMAEVVGDEFTMGSPTREVGRDDAFEEQIVVSLRYNYAIAVRELTQRNWQTLLDGALPDGQSFKGDDHPVTNFTWWSALAIANALSINHGFEPCYEPPPDARCQATPADYRSGTAFCAEEVEPIIRAPDGDVLRCEGYRLPTEAEWEFAARAGSPGALHGTSAMALNLLDNDLTCTPNSQPALTQMAWWCGSPTSSVQAVGGLSPNTWGLSDVLGNAAEWTWDGFNPKIAGGINPHRDQMRPWSDVGGEPQPRARAVRGGAWNGRSAADTRLAARHFAKPDTRDPGIGLRLVRTLP